MCVLRSIKRLHLPHSGPEGEDEGLPYRRLWMLGGELQEAPLDREARWYVFCENCKERHIDWGAPHYDWRGTWIVPQRVADMSEYEEWDECWNLAEWHWEAGYGQQSP
jgi:hypothetical protein